MHSLFIRELNIDTIIGVYAWERKIRQTIVVDLEMRIDSVAAAGADEIEHAVDYSVVAQRITELAQSLQAHLVEHLAEQIAATLLAEFPVAQVRLTVTKSAALPRANGVGVIIERSR